MKKKDVMEYYNACKTQFERAVNNRSFYSKEICTLEYGKIYGMLQMLYACDYIATPTYLKESTDIFNIFDKVDKNYRREVY